MALVQTTGPLERALLLRALPLFSAMRTAQLAALARVADESQVRPGTVLQAGNQPPRALQVLLDGAVRLARGAGGATRLDAPAALGLLDLLAERTGGLTIIADTSATLLTIDSALWWDVLEDDFALVMRLRAALGRTLAWHAAAQRAYDVAPGPSPRPDAAAGPPADAVDLLLRLHRMPLLTPFGVAVLAALVRSADGPRYAAPGTVLVQAGARATHLLVLLDGAAECRAIGAPPVRVERGTVLGENAALSELPQAHTAVAVTPVVVLELEAQRVWDVAEDHFHVARALLARAACRLLELDPGAASRGALAAVPVDPVRDEELV